MAVTTHSLLSERHISIFAAAVFWILSRHCVVVVLLERYQSRVLQKPTGDDQHIQLLVRCGDADFVVEVGSS